MNIKSIFIGILKKYFPIIQWSQDYRLQFIKHDLIAGITVGLTLIPQALAYGSLAGLKPQYGLFSSFWGPFIYLFLGTSRDLTLGPTAILSLLVAHYSRQSPFIYDPTYAIALALLSGIVQLALGLFKLGFLANFMSPTVVSAFTTSGAILIAWGQVKTLLGLQNIHSEFFQSLYEIFANIQKSNVSDTILGLFCLCFLILFKILGRLDYIQTTEETRFEKVFHKIFWFISISSNIVIIILSTLLAYILNTYDIGRLSLTGSIQRGLPKFKLPQFQICNSTHVIKRTSQFFMEIGSGIPVITLIALVEAMAIGKAFARKNGYRMRSSQEFIAIGFSNIVGSFFQAFPITGSFSRTAINSQCSSRSPISGVITGIVIVLALQLLTPYFVYIPNTTLAAIIIVAVVFMTDFHFIIRTWKINKMDTVTWMVTFIVSLGFGVEYGVFTGISISLLPVLFEASRPHFELDAHRSEYQGSHLWFPFISKLSTMLENMDNGKCAILDMKGVRSIDSAIYNCLQDAGEDYRKQKKVLILISDSFEISEMFTNAGDHGLHCFKSIVDAEDYFPSILKDDWFTENISILPNFADNI